MLYSVVISQLSEVDFSIEYCICPTDAVLAGTRRKVKVEKIPLLSTASGADDVKDKETKENVSAASEAVETPSTIDDTRTTDSDTLLPTVSASSTLPSPHSKKSPQKENTLSMLSTWVQNMAQVDAAAIEKDGLSGVGGERQSTLSEKLMADAEEKLSQISSAMNAEVEDSHMRLVGSVQHQQNEPQMCSASMSKPVIDTAVHIENKSRVNVESVPTAERQGREKNKPKVINVRRATDGPDQNCKAQ